MILPLLFSTAWSKHRRLSNTCIQVLSTAADVLWQICWIQEAHMDYPCSYGLYPSTGETVSQSKPDRGHRSWMWRSLKTCSLFHGQEQQREDSMKRWERAVMNVKKSELCRRGKKKAFQIISPQAHISWGNPEVGGLEDKYVGLGV